MPSFKITKMEDYAGNFVITNPNNSTRLVKTFFNDASKIYVYNISIVFPSVPNTCEYLLGLSNSYYPEQFSNSDINSTIGIYTKSIITVPSNTIRSWNVNLSSPTTTSLSYITSNPLTDTYYYLFLLTSLNTTRTISYKLTFMELSIC